MPADFGAGLVVSVEGCGGSAQWLLRSVMISASRLLVMIGKCHLISDRLDIKFVQTTKLSRAMDLGRLRCQNTFPLGPCFLT